MSGTAAWEPIVAKKDTKFCELTIRLQSGEQISGRLHVPVGTSSAMRPSDVIRDLSTDFILLSRVVIRLGTDSMHKETLLVFKSAISYIELSTTNWAT